MSSENSDKSLNAIKKLKTIFEDEKVIAQRIRLTLILV